MTDLEQPPADARVIDSRGRLCPLPVIDLAKAMVTVDVGGCVAIVSDDAAAASDIPAWCELRRQEFVGSWPDDNAMRYVVRKLHDG